MLPEFELLIKKIRTKRKQLGLTQKELAKRAGVSQSLIAKLETKRNVPNYKSIRKVVKALEKLETEGKTAGEVANKEIISVNVKDRVKKAKELMLKHNFSQLPVERKGDYVGSVSSGELMDVPKEKRLGEVMESVFDIVSGETPVSAVRKLLKQSKNAVLVRGSKSGKIEGIITPADLL